MGTMNWLQKIAMFVDGKGSTLVAYQSRIFLIDSDADTNDPTVRRMANFLGTSTRDLVANYSDTYDYLRSLRDYRPDVLQGRIDNGALTLMAENFQHSSGSRLLQNVMKTLGLDLVDYQNSEEVYRSLDSSLITGNLPEVLFHGTTSMYATEILTYGLQPGRSTTNYPGGGIHGPIVHNDVVFLTEDMDSAAGHANNATYRQKGFPVIFGFRIPDPNLLLPDYDIEVMSGEIGVYTNTYRAPVDKYSPQIKEPAFDFSKKTGIFGYKGRIPASFIVEIKIRMNDGNQENQFMNDEWVSVNSSQLKKALDYGGPEFYNEPDEVDEDEEFVEGRYAMTNWLTKTAQTTDEDDLPLAWVLGGPNEDTRVGVESGSPVQNGVAIYKDKYGSHRYVYYENGQAISGIQVMSNGKTSNVANIYTRPEYQRRGLATQLFNRAKMDFPDLQHSKHTTDKGTSWIRSLAQLQGEVFITEDGFVLGADGDVGDYNHDSVAMEHILGASLDNTEDMESIDAESLTDEQLDMVERNFPGFISMVWTGKLLPKEFAVLKMGWIRVINDNFEVNTVDENALSRIADYAVESNYSGDENISVNIEEMSTGKFVSMPLSELAESTASGQGMVRYTLRLNRGQYQFGF